MEQMNTFRNKVILLISLLTSVSTVYLLQNFKREEQNFVVQNEINNLGFLTGEAKTKMSKVNGYCICFVADKLLRLLYFLYIS